MHAADTRLLALLQVHNAMWTHFSEDPATLSRDGQYMWANTLLFTPVLEEGASAVTGYFPRALWYSMTDVGFINASLSGQTVTFETPVSTTNVHVRGGAVVPMQQAGMTTRAVQDSPFTLLVALDVDHSAAGALFLDDGVQSELAVTTFVTYSVASGSNTLVSSLSAGSSFNSGASLQTVQIRGVETGAGATCSGQLTLQQGAVTLTPSATVLTTGQFYSTLTLTFSGVDVASEYSMSWDCSDNSSHDDDDDEGVFGNVFVLISVIIASIVFVGSLMFVASRVYCRRDVTDKDEALLTGDGV